MNLPRHFLSERARMICVALLFFAATISFAADISPQPYRLETVVVTGVADAPASGSSVTLLTGETLADRGATSLRELTALMPNFATFDANGDRTPRFSARGLRENNFSYGESAVGIYVDDVPYSDLYTRGITLFDFYGGEFYRGPQPTLFGANRPGGVLNLLTRLPGNDWHGHSSVSYGSYEAVGVEAGLDGPLVKDKLFFGISGLFSKRDGYFDNLVTRNDPDHHETLAGRAQLRWTPTERLDFTASIFADRFRDGGVIVKPIAAPGDFFDVKYDQDGFNRQDSHTYALRGAWTGDSVKVVSVTTWRDWRQSVAGDFDFAEFSPEIYQFLGIPPNSPLNGLQGFARPKVQNWSQEFRVESLDKEKPLKWNAGAYWAQLTTDYASGYNYGPLAPIIFQNTNTPTSGTDLTSGRNRSDDYAVFGQLTYTVAEKLDIIGGLRFEYVDVRGTRNHTFSGFPISAPRTYEDNFRSLQPRAGLVFRFTPDVTAWFNFTTGFQPGGFSSSSDNGGVSSYDAAESRNYEMGVSAKLLDGKIIASANGFLTDTRDYQVYRPVITASMANPLDFYILNAKEARTIGAELELRVLPCEYFEFRFAGGWQNAEFEKFTTPGPVSQKLDGKDINFVPEFTLDASVTARTKCGLYATLGVTAIGDYWFDESNTTKQSAYALLHARAGWENKNFGVAIFGRNLTDEHYYANALDLGPRGGPTDFFVGTPGDPLTVGVEVSARF